MEKITQFILNTGIAGTWFLFVTMNTFAQNGWEKIPTGTRYDITRLILFSDTTGVFLADRIYRIDRKQIRPMSLPGSSGFRCLSSFSSESFCFIKYTPFSGSRLFVYEKGVISEPENPFANQITAISMTGPQEGILSGFAETAVLKEGNLQTLPPYPSRSMCVKIAAFSTDRFYILTRNGEVFEYNHGDRKSVV